MQDFGTTKDGELAKLVTLVNSNGLVARLTNYGATLVQMIVPKAGGIDVVLGFDDVAGYESDANQYFGCTAGRVCNRTAAGTFDLNGVTCTLAKNDNGVNHLHGGGDRALSKVLWQIAENSGQRVKFSHTSPDGEEGYPGTLDVSIEYTLTDDNQLVLSYQATSDEATPVNLTNHAYWNLNGHASGTVLDHELVIHADSYTPTDEGLIPTGEIEPVAGTPLDFRQGARIGERVGELDNTPNLGYDHNYVLSMDQRGELSQAATLTAAESGISMDVLTDMPGIQLYSGNFLKGDTGKDGAVYPYRCAVCLETQFFPDAVHHGNFPSIILQPGQTFNSTTTHAFSF